MAQEESPVQTPSLLMSPDVDSPVTGPLTPGSAAIKLCPFNMIGRGVAGIDEMREHMDDSKVYFGLLVVEVGSGHFARRKNLFIHFNSENHPKPLLRAKMNKKLKKAQDLMGQFHISLTVPNKDTFTVNWVFARCKKLFIADDSGVSNLQNEYKAMMLKAAKEAEAARKKLEEEKKRREEEMRLKAQQEEEERLAKIAAEEEAARLAKEEEERKEREAKEAAEAAEKAKKEEEERAKQEEEEAKNKKKGKKTSFKDDPNGEQNDGANGGTTKKKKGKKKKRKKDDWSDERPWTTQRVLKAVHADVSPFNWAIVAPHDPTGKEELKCLHWGHGSIANLREHLDETCVQYGIMRLAFGSGKFKRSHFVFFIWTPDTMTEKAPPELRTKKNKERMKHVSWKDHMKDALSPCNVTVVAESLEKVGVEEWILRVRNTVVVDSNGEDLTAEAVQKALLEEKKWLEELRRKQEEEAEKRRKLERHERARSQKKLEAKMALQKELEAEELANSEMAKGAEKYRKESRDDSKASDEFDEDEEGSVSASNASNAQDDDENNNQPEPIQVQMSEEELAKIEEERKKQAALEEKRRKEREKHLQDVLQSQICYESIQLVHSEKDATCWVLFEPKMKK